MRLPETITMRVIMSTATMMIEKGVLRIPEDFHRMFHLLDELGVLGCISHPFVLLFTLFQPSE